MYTSMKNLFITNPLFDVHMFHYIQCCYYSAITILSLTLASRTTNFQIKNQNTCDILHYIPLYGKNYLFHYICLTWIKRDYTRSGYAYELKAKNYKHDALALAISSYNYHHHYLHFTIFLIRNETTCTNLKYSRFCCYILNLFFL